MQPQNLRRFLAYSLLIWLIMAIFSLYAYFSRHSVFGLEMLAIITVQLIVNFFIVKRNPSKNDNP